jgi:uncharacterized RDD family membrane protein YckC
MSDKREVKQCPFCSEEILATAKKCKHCHSFIEEEPAKETYSTEIVEPNQMPKMSPPVPPKASSPVPPPRPVAPKAPPPPPSRGSFQQDTTGATDSSSPAPKAPAPAPPPRPAVPKAPPVQAAGIAATASAQPDSQTTLPSESTTQTAAANQAQASASVPEKIRVGDAYNYPKAPIGKRIVAYIVDSLIAGLPVIIYTIFIHFDYLYLLKSILRYPDSLLHYLRNFPLALLLVTWLIFYMLLRDGFGTGQSWGKKMQGLMVVNLVSNEPCNKGKSAARNAIALVIVFILGLIPIINIFAGMVDPIIAIANPKGHRIGDMLAKTQVIEVGKYEVKGE